MKHTYPAIVIEANVPMPEGRLGNTGVFVNVRNELKKMQDGQSFCWTENSMVYRAAKQAGVLIKTRKIDGKGYRVWRVKKL